MKHTTEPAPQDHRARLVRFLWGDVVALMDTHSVRIDRRGKGRGSWGDRAVRETRTAIRSYLKSHDLPVDCDYAVPLYWVYQFLLHDDGVGEDPRFVDHDKAEHARRTLLAAFNAPQGGLEIVPQRWMQYAS